MYWQFKIASNQGSNWIVSMNYNKTENLLTSPNVENLSNFCVDNVNKVRESFMIFFQNRLKSIEHFINVGYQKTLAC